MNILCVPGRLIDSLFDYIIATITLSAQKVLAPITMGVPQMTLC